MEATTEINLTILWDIVIPLAVAVLTALAGWLSVRATSYFKLKSDDVVRKYLDEILTRGVSFAASQMEEAAKNYPKAAVKNVMIASAANFALKQAPDAIARFGLTPAQVEAMVSARLAKLTSLAAVGANDNAANDNASDQSMAADNTLSKADIWAPPSDK
ncbi:hypothetical protein SAMN07250955_106133 [Arboricoccus pini]|uniref:Bacteriophage holin of superfamily 6 (Holin_LLH) n=1 Tax=Arboricoccus pini TaxID=1963835 RepID=A0A212R7K1_9PROT|nr:hypothetical protein [Arboricoccus pini]SNB68119.1 hypothetical protein SAMN07250955_106133 [Arboricoccus pini]